jgi:hypothetical protein
MGSLRSLRQKTWQELGVYPFIKSLELHRFGLINEEWGNPDFVTLTFRHPLSREGFVVMIDYKRNGFVPIYHPSHVAWNEGYSIRKNTALIKDNIYNTVKTTIESGRMKNWSRE